MATQAIPQEDQEALLLVRPTAAAALFPMSCHLILASSCSDLPQPMTVRICFYWHALLVRPAALILLQTLANDA